ncbi:MAG: hypothetical protein SGI92_25740 [Bryobacteraceae bacterium]|nr:hypothetical protein [Bryobacteraceae bacterium]
MRMPGNGIAQAPDEIPVFRSQTSLALVHFHVVRKKQYVTNLKPEDIDLLEDGKPQKIGLFEGGLRSRRSLPVEMVLLFDTSGSVVQPGLLDLKAALLDALPQVSLRAQVPRQIFVRAPPTTTPGIQTGAYLVASRSIAGFILAGGLAVWAPMPWRSWRRI